LGWRSLRLFPWFIGMTHKDNFPDDGEVVRRILELEDWKKYTNRLLFGIIFGAMGTILSFGIWVGTVQTSASHNHESLTSLDVTNKEYGTRINRLEINNSDIKARLISIEATLQEIKQSISRIK